jgi:hypothetical protein
VEWDSENNFLTDLGLEEIVLQVKLVQLGGILSNQVYIQGGMMLHK